MDCLDTSYYAHHITHSGSGTITGLNMTNFKSGGNYLIQLTATNASGVTISSGLTNSGGSLTDVRTNVSSDVVLAQNEIAILSIFINGTVAFVSFSKFS
jgi:hypothetical protein